MENVLRMAEHNNNINGFITKTPRILVADDEATIRKIIKLVLEQSRYEVVEASNGEEALTIISKNTFDLILLDIMLPRIDGYEVCEIVRLNPDYRNVKIIFLTAKGREVEIAKGLALGADAYITKPFSNTELVAKVKELLEKTYEEAGE